ncbi:MAG: BLUF domain-containing protein [Chloroflexi bacterium]|nr:BLUF domain-containing protein [Chloroflexota bacterium]
MSLFSLVYVSFASHDLTDDELKDILVVARDTNKPLEITGMLLYRDRFFIQALEGDEAAVRGLYEKIAKDPRHINVLTVYTGPIEARRFPDWTMGFNKIADATVEQLPGFTDFLNRPGDGAFFTENPDRAVMLLELFKNESFY